MILKEGDTVLPEKALFSLSFFRSKVCGRKQLTNIPAGWVNHPVSLDELQDYIAKCSGHILCYLCKSYDNLSPEKY